MPSGGLAPVPTRMCQQQSQARRVPGARLGPGLRARAPPCHPTAGPAARRGRPGPPRPAGASSPAQPTLAPPASGPPPRPPAWPPGRLLRHARGPPVRPVRGAEGWGGGGGGGGGGGAAGAPGRERGRGPSTCLYLLTHPSGLLFSLSL